MKLLWAEIGNNFAGRETEEKFLGFSAKCCMSFTHDDNVQEGSQSHDHSTERTEP